DDDRRVARARPDLLHGPALVGEMPAELVVAPQLLDHPIAGVDVPGRRGGGALVQVDDGDVDGLGVGVRVPERRDVHPRIERRGEPEPDVADPRFAYRSEAPGITREHTPRVAHHSSVRIAPVPLRGSDATLTAAPGAGARWCAGWSGAGVWARPTLPLGSARHLGHRQRRARS